MISGSSTDLRTWLRLLKYWKDNFGFSASIAAISTLDQNQIKMSISQNSYLKHYLSLKIEISPQLPREQALLLASQAALLHNALGFVIKDIVQMMSFRYQQSNDQEEDVEKFRKVEEVIANARRDQARLSIPEIQEIDDSKSKSVNYRRGGNTLREGDKRKSNQTKECQIISVPIKRFYSPGDTIKETQETQGVRQNKEADPGSSRVSCGKCDRFYQVVGYDNPELCNCSSRHRKTKGRASDVPNFDNFFDI